MQYVKDYDEPISMQFVNTWNNMRVIVNGVSFEINEEVIDKVGEFSLDG